MSKYNTEEGVIVDTDKAVASWQEDSDWNGSNHISRATGSQWEHETLHKSSKGRYYIEYWSQWQGSMPGARFVSNEEAAKWLMNNNKELPSDLAQLEAKISE